MFPSPGDLFTVSRPSATVHWAVSCPARRPTGPYSCRRKEQSHRRRLAIGGARRNHLWHRLPDLGVFRLGLGSLLGPDTSGGSETGDHEGSKEMRVHCSSCWSPGCPRHAKNRLRQRQICCGILIKIHSCAGVCAENRGGGCRGEGSLASGTDA